MDVSLFDWLFVFTTPQGHSGHIAITWLTQLKKLLSIHGYGHGNYLDRSIGECNLHPIDSYRFTDRGPVYSFFFPIPVGADTVNDNNDAAFCIDL